MTDFTLTDFTLTDFILTDFILTDFTLTDFTLTDFTHLADRKPVRESNFSLLEYWATCNYKV